MWDFKCMRGRFSKLFFSWQSIFFSASFLVRIALTGKGWNSVEQGWNKLGHIRGDASEQFRWSGWAILGHQRARPLSVSFLFRTSGKETEVASPLGMEKYGRFDFSPWKPEYLAHNRPELMMAYADVQFSLFRFQFHALLRSGEPLFPRWLLKLLAKVLGHKHVKMYESITAQHISQVWNLLWCVLWYDWLIQNLHQSAVGLTNARRRSLVCSTTWKNCFMFTTLVYFSTCSKDWKRSDPKTIQKIYCGVESSWRQTMKSDANLILRHNISFDRSFQQHFVNYSWLKMWYLAKVAIETEILEWVMGYCWCCSFKRRKASYDVQLKRAVFKRCYRIEKPFL